MGYFERNVLAFYRDFIYFNETSSMHSVQRASLICFPALGTRPALPPLQEITLQAEASCREKMSPYSGEAISVLCVASTVITFSSMSFTLLINIYRLLFKHL